MNLHLEVNDNIVTRLELPLPISLTEVFALTGSKLVFIDDLR